MKFEMFELFIKLPVPERVVPEPVEGSKGSILFNSLNGNNMRLYILIVLCILSTISMGFLIVALTDIMPSEPLKEYRTVIAIGFIMFGGFTRIAYKNYRDQKSKLL